MPTSSSTSTDRRVMTSPERSPCARMTSANWTPIWVTGLRAFMALCMTTDRSRQRVAESSRAVMVTRSRPLNRTLPVLIRAGGLSNWARPNSMVDLPQPDSPTTPTNSPGYTSRSKESTARTGPAGVSYSTVSPRTSRSGVPSTGTSDIGALGTGPPDWSESRVADLVERIVEQREGRAEEGDAQAGRDHPQRLTGLQGAVVLRPVQHRAPAQRGAVAEADELQARRREHRVEGAAEEGGQDERRHRGQDLEQDDVGAALPPDPGGLEEVAVAQRERLRPQLPCAVRPTGDHEDTDDDEQVAFSGVGGDHDDQRKGRHDQEHVGHRREGAVRVAAQV